MLLAARGLALILAKNTSVGVATNTGFIPFGQGDFLGVPIPAIVLALAYICGVIVLRFTRFGRHVLATQGKK